MGGGLPPIQTFSGSTKEDPLVWLDTYSRYAAIRNWDENCAVKSAALLLAGGALEWFLEYEQTFTTWTAFQTKFKDQFLSAAMKSKWKHELKALKQGQDQPVEDLVNAFRVYFRKLGISDEETRLEYLTDGLLPQYRVRLLREKPSSFSAAYHLALEEEAILRDYPLPASNGSSHGDETDSAIRQLTNQLQELTINFIAQKKSSPGKKQIVCYRCQEVGHLARHCTAPAPVARSEGQRRVQTIDFVADAPADDPEVLAVEKRKSTTQLESTAKKIKKVAPASPKTIVRLAKTTGLEPYDINQDLAKVQPSISLAQLLLCSPSVRNQLAKELRRTSIDSPVNALENSSSAKATVTVAGNDVIAILDTGAAMSVISSSLVNALDLEFAKSSRRTLVMADGVRRVPLGEIANLDISIGELGLTVDLVVIDSHRDILILGVDFLANYGITINVKSSEAYIEDENTKYVIPLVSPDATPEEVTMIGFVEDTEIQPPANGEKGPRVGEMDPATKVKFEQLLEANKDVFASEVSDLTQTNRAVHLIPTGDSAPVFSRQYRLTPMERNYLMEEIPKLVASGVITPAESPWNSPIIFVKKPGSKELRLCVDFRRVNALTTPDRFYLPLLEQLQDVMFGSKVFSVIDMFKGFWQVPIHPADRDKTAFSTFLGTYKFNVMAYGLRNAPSTFQRLVNNVFQDLLWKNVVIFIDDLCVFTPDMDTHVKILEEVFSRIRENNLKCNVKKCRFAFGSVTYLGHCLSGQGISLDDSKVAAITSLKPPTSVKELRSFLGLCGFFRRFVPAFATIVKPLNRLLRKNSVWSWGFVENNAFCELQQMLTSRPVLGFPNFDAPFHLTTDASYDGIAAMLWQVGDDGQPISICYASRKLSDSEERYAVTHLEGLAVVWACTHFRTYLMGSKFFIHTDHSALVHMFSQPQPQGQFARWVAKLLEFDFDVDYVKGCKNPVDYLSRYVAQLGHHEGDDLDAELLIVDTDVGMSKAKYDIILQFLSQAAYPSGADTAFRKKIRRWASFFYCSDGKLYKKSDNDLPVELLHQENVLGVVKKVHDEHHQGAHRTWLLVKQRFYSPQLFDAVRKVVNSCETCQLFAKKAANTSGIPPDPGRIFDTWSVDVVGPIHAGSEPKYLYVAIEHISKWIVARPFDSVDVESAITFLIEEIVLVYGVPQRLISDHGTNFTSLLFEQTLKSLGIVHSMSTPYRPSSNGLVERANQTLIRTLAKFCTGTSWSSKLRHALFTCRVSVNQSTGKSPFELVFGQQPMIPSAWHPIPTPDTDLSTQVAERIAKLESVAVSARSAIQERNKRNQLVWKLRKDLLDGKKKFSAGDIVLLHDPLAKKLSPKWKGPYRVVKCLSNGAVVIKSDFGDEKVVNKDSLHLVVQ